MMSCSTSSNNWLLKLYLLCNKGARLVSYDDVAEEEEDSGEGAKYQVF